MRGGAVITELAEADIRRSNSSELSTDKLRKIYKKLKATRAHLVYLLNRTIATPAATERRRRRRRRRRAATATKTLKLLSSAAANGQGSKPASSSNYYNYTRRRRSCKMHYYMGGSDVRRVAGADVDLASAVERIERLARENAVVVFSVSSCCMCHVVKRLLCGLGVNPTVYELDEDNDVGPILKLALSTIVGEPAVPAVFIGGKLVGGVDSVMATHISGGLVPLLKDAGALWL